MLLLAILLATPLHADGSVAELVNEGFRIPPHEYRFIPLTIANWPATLVGSAAVSQGGPVRVELLSQRELGNFVRGRSYDFILQVNPRLDMRFRQAVPDKGEYDLVLVNDHEQASDVRLEASVEFAREPDVARYLSPGRKLAVIATSLLIFLGIISWSGFRLMRAMQDATRSSDSH